MAETPALRPKSNITVEYLTDGKREHFFPGCEHVTSKVEEQKCSEEMMIKFINTNLNFPVLMCSSEGTVIVYFTVAKDGSIKDEIIIQEIGGGCGEEVLRVVRKMPKWTPGKARGKPVYEKFKLSVKFNLD